jgi:hypothetical protein
MSIEAAHSRAQALVCFFLGPLGTIVLLRFLFDLFATATTACLFAPAETDDLLALAFILHLTVPIVSIDLQCVQIMTPKLTSQGDGGETNMLYLECLGVCGQ